MERILFGDNQFFGINHQSEEKSRAQAIKFKTNESVLRVLEHVFGCGVSTFMCTTHDRIWEICDVVRDNPDRFPNFKFYPCMPYAHKYANAITELGTVGALKKFMPDNLVGAIAKGGMALAKRDFVGIMKLLVDAEMKMFKGLDTPVIFIQNVVTDLLLGLGMHNFFGDFASYIRKEFNAEPGFITMNMPKLVEVFDEQGLEGMTICSSINKIGFRMPGGVAAYEEALKTGKHNQVAMQVLAGGAVPPREAFEYVCGLEGVNSILFGASTPAHISDSIESIKGFDNGAA